MDVALELCAQYLNEKWRTANPSQLTCTEIKIAKCNRLFHCKLIDNVNGEMKHAIVRFYGNDFSGIGNKFKSLSEPEEAIIFHNISKYFSAPKLLGVFPGGRIEEFINVDSISTETYESNQLATFLAKFIAQIQCLKIPISRIPNNLLFNVRKMSDIFECNKNESKYRGNVYSNYFSNFNFKREINWLKNLVPKVTSQRTVFVHVDLNKTNIVKRIDINQYLVLDYEFSKFSYRWVDLSVYFCELISNHFEYGKQIDFHFYPNEKQRKQFINIYLNELGRNVTKFDANVNNEDTMIFETDFGAMFIMFERMLFMLTHHSFGMDEYGNLEIAKCQLQVYQHLKNGFQCKYNL